MISNAQFDIWAKQSKDLGLKQLVISMDGFNPDDTLLEVVERGQKELILGEDRFTEIDLCNDGYAFEQFSVPIDCTFGEAAKLIDIIMQARGDERTLFLEVVEEMDMDAVTECIFFRVFLGS